MTIRQYLNLLENVKKRYGLSEIQLFEYNGKMNLIVVSKTNCNQAKVDSVINELHEVMDSAPDYSISFKYLQSMVV
ncbi:hypothetical protein HOK51_04285 [Candidatus Woesearchaeota archaeon]|nr:hypothetical protein [Candidatus Woesearchaeota archaeon]MBT6519041.1 hypothetical protein [Candidatus Woesearchaeota archaeon]MBT7367477.1 hypothetical protein [Candidatus Woesearchaeota archaeon]